MKRILTHLTGKTEGRTWTFFNDVRLVGELTKVIRKIAHGHIIQGWSKIVSHRRFQTPDKVQSPDNVPGMSVVGPVYYGENRESILDACPIFVRAHVG